MRTKNTPNMAGDTFSIEDAFQSDEDDAIRLYGSTNESCPLQKKSRKYDEGDVNDQTAIVGNTSKDSHRGSSRGSSRSNLNRASSSYSFDSNFTESYSVATKTFPERYWWRHPKVRENWKIVLASFLLFLIGITLIVVGIVIEATKYKAIHSVLFFIAGVICLIPGAYHVVYIYCAVKGKKGFSFYNMPVFK